MEPHIRYARTRDGVNIAYTIVGEGPPLLFMRRFMAPGLDDELKFSFSTWGPLARVRSVVLMDIRGSGLSDQAPDATFDQWVADMEAVVEAVGADQVDLASELTPCHFAIGYALLHPDKVGNLVLWNPSAGGTSPRARMPQWHRDLAMQDWKSFADVLALQVFGWKRADAAERFAERLRLHLTPEQYEHMMDAIESIEVAEVSGVRAPTLIISDENFLGGVGDRSFAEKFTRQLAARIPSAQLAIIKSGNFTGAGMQPCGFSSRTSRSTRGPTPNGPQPPSFSSPMSSTPRRWPADSGTQSFANALTNSTTHCAPRSARQVERLSKAVP